MAPQRKFGSVTAYRIRSQNCGWAATAEGIIVVVNPSRMIVRGGSDAPSDRKLPEVSEITIGLTEGVDSMLDDNAQYVGSSRSDLIEALDWIRTGS